MSTSGERVEKPAVESRDRDDAGAARKRVPMWGRVLFVCSVTLMVVGCAMMGVGWLTGGEDGPGAPAREGAGEGALVAPGFVSEGAPGEGPSAGEQAGGGPSILRDWSPTIFRLGFSFFVGFAIAFALRAFFKIALVVIGLMLLALFGLQYAGVIDVDWSAMESVYDTVAGWLREQTDSFSGFIRGYLPSAAAAALGLAAGFRRS